MKLLSQFNFQELHNKKEKKMYEYAVSYEINFFDAVRPTSMEIFLRVQE
jgi:hypothetical protein